MIATRLKKVRKQKMMTQQELADAAGVSRRGIINLESGHSGQFRTIRALAEALGVEPSELVEKEQS